MTGWTSPTGALLHAVPVRGGDLAVATWGPPGGTVVVAAHGITASHVFWQPVGERLAAAGVRLLAPDLRGRGLSAPLPGPSSMAQHARDLLAVLDDAAVERAVVVGHSMGGFVAAVTAVAHPDRVSATVLVDGGPPLTGPLPADTDVQAVLHGIIGPSLERLGRTFADRAAYRAFWHAHPAFAAGGLPDGLLDAYADHDLVADGAGRWRSRVVADRILEDARDTLVSASVTTAVDRITGPVRLVVAERGMLDGSEGLYTAAAVASAQARNPGLVVETVPGTNHFTIGMGAPGADAVAAEVQAAVAAAG